jgi:hypothetical protein
VAINLCPAEECESRQAATILFRKSLHATGFFYYAPDSAGK